MTLDAGDTEERSSVTLDAGSNSVSGGDAVKFDGSGNITPTTANSDDYVGVVLNQVAAGDNKWTVHVCGQVVNIKADGAVSAGATLVPSGTTDGHWVSHTGGMYINNTDTGANDVAANHPFALEGAADGDVFRAAFR